MEDMIIEPIEDFGLSKSNNKRRSFQKSEL